MAAATFEQVAAWNQALIRRPNKGFVLIGDDDATLPAAYTSGVSSEFQELVDFDSLGLIAKDAPPTFRPAVESNDIESWGGILPRRHEFQKGRGMGRHAWSRESAQRDHDL
ncbi:hypothetical protein, partial [Nocardia brasiliensis]|uniref:hypothetical protein n=1 Tax=Nocardia brasiliensis TaxID=37326 RepID=UPI0024586563